MSGAKAVKRRPGGLLMGLPPDTRVVIADVTWNDYARLHRVHDSNDRENASLVFELLQESLLQSTGVTRVMSNTLRFGAFLDAAVSRRSHNPVAKPTIALYSARAAQCVWNGRASISI